jgi:hypothetical protein
MNSSLALLLFIVLLLLLLDDPFGLPANMGYVPGMYIPFDDAYAEGIGLMPWLTPASPPLDVFR